MHNFALSVFVVLSLWTQQLAWGKSLVENKLEDGIKKSLENLIRFNEEDAGHREFSNKRNSQSEINFVRQLSNKKRLEYRPTFPEDSKRRAAIATNARLRVHRKTAVPFYYQDEESDYHTHRRGNSLDHLLTNTRSEAYNVLDNQRKGKRSIVYYPIRTRLPIEFYLGRHTAYESYPQRLPFQQWMGRRGNKRQRFAQSVYGGYPPFPYEQRRSYLPFFQNGR